MTAKKFGLSRDALKLIAILAMTLDHIAWAFVPTASYKGQILHFFGRLTVVIMTLFISEGFIHTKNFNRYLGRLLVFAVITQPIYIFYQHPKSFLHLSLKYYLDFNVLFSLSFALLALKILSTKTSVPLKIIGILSLCALSYHCDWCFMPIVLAIVFYFTKSDKKKRVVYFIILATAFALFYIIRFKLRYHETWHTTLRYEIMMTGLYLGIIPIILYNGKRGGGGKATKWFFYAYYPVHMLVLGLIKYFIK